VSEERITEIRDDEGPIHTHTTIIRDSAPEQRSGMGVIGLLVLLAIIAAAALLIFNQMGEAKAVKDVAVSEAVEDVGNAANQVGDAVERGVDNLTE
jgi:hypothetical protein